MCTACESYIMKNVSDYADALASGREGLALFGVRFPESTKKKQAALEQEIESIQSLLGGRSIDSLIDLPVMTDPEIRMVMSILTTIWSSAYISGNQVLTRLISATMVRLSLIHGNSEESAYGYATHAITVGPLREDYKAAYEFGSLALQVNERFNDSRRRAKICQQFQAHVNPLAAAFEGVHPLCARGPPQRLRDRRFHLRDLRRVHRNLGGYGHHSKPRSIRA